MNWTLTAIPCSSFVGDAATGSRRCTLKKMDSVLTINVWITGGSSGPGFVQKSGTLPARNTAGSWKGCRSTSPKPSALPGGRISERCAKGRKFSLLLQIQEKHRRRRIHMKAELERHPGDNGLPFLRTAVCEWENTAFFAEYALQKLSVFHIFLSSKMTVAVWWRIRFSAGFPV